jgi:hypothetical protein
LVGGGGEQRLPALLAAGCLTESLYIGCSLMMSMSPRRAQARTVGFETPSAVAAWVMSISAGRIVATICCPGTPALIDIAQPTTERFPAIFLGWT